MRIRRQNCVRVVILTLGLLASSLSTSVTSNRTEKNGVCARSNLSVARVDSGSAVESIVPDDEQQQQQQQQIIATSLRPPKDAEQQQLWPTAASGPADIGQEAEPTFVTTTTALLVQQSCRQKSDESVLNPAAAADNDDLLAHDERTVCEPAAAANDDSLAESEESATEKTPSIATFDEWTKERLTSATPSPDLPQAIDQPQNGENASSSAGNASESARNRTVSGGNASNGTDAAAGIVKLSQPSQPQRNYASKECGAKLLVANDEAEHRSAVLNDKDKDDYMRNPCAESVQKYLVVELCESVQLTTLELGNYELFSGGPRNVRVLVADRFPTPEWTVAAEIEAADSRLLQSFPLATKAYAKFVKIELLTHYGREHYCTLSVVRILGKSIMDEYLEEEDRVAGRLAHTATPPPPPQVSVQPTPVVVVVESEKSTKPAVVDVVNKAVEGMKQVIESVGKKLLHNKKQEPETRQRQPKWVVPFDCRQCFIRPTAAERWCQVFGRRWWKLKRVLTVGDANGTAAIDSSEIGGDNRSSSPTTMMATDHKDAAATDQISEELILVDEAELESEPPRPPPAPVDRQSPSASCASLPSNLRWRQNWRPPAAAAAAAAAAAQRVEKLPPPKKQHPPKEEKPAEPIQQQPQILVPPEPAPPRVVPAPAAEARLPNGIPASSGNNLKESVLLKLNKRVSAVELNISLSSQYLSELSRQYVQQVDVHQRNITSTLHLVRRMNETLGAELASIRAELRLVAEWLSSVRAAAHRDAGMARLPAAAPLFSTYYDRWCAAAEQDPKCGHGAQKRTSKSVAEQEKQKKRQSSSMCGADKTAGAAAAQQQKSNEKVSKIPRQRQVEAKETQRDQLKQQQQQHTTTVDYDEEEAQRQEEDEFDEEDELFDEDHHDDDDDEEEESVVTPLPLTADGIWTTEQVVYVVLVFQSITALLVVCLQLCIARRGASSQQHLASGTVDSTSGPLVSEDDHRPLTRDDVRQLVTEMLAAEERRRRNLRQHSGQSTQNVDHEEEDPLLDQDDVDEDEEDDDAATSTSNSSDASSALKRGAQTEQRIPPPAQNPLVVLSAPA